MNTGTIILGLGAMGTAAAWALARRGVRVLGLDRFDAGHAHGSSHGLTRLTRLCYFEHPDYVPLLRRSYELWRELEAESGRALLHLTGGLFAGPRESAFVVGMRLAAARHGLALETLDHAGARRRFPHLRPPESHEIVFEPTAGYILSDLAVSAMADRARVLGAELRRGEPALRWHADGRGVQVQTPAGSYHAQTLIISAGAWLPGLAGDPGVPLTVTRQAVAWFDAPDPLPLSPPAMPVWAMLGGDGVLNYGVPNLSAGAGGPGLKAARHTPGEPADPDQARRPVDAGDTGPIEAFMRAHIPGAGRVLRAATCLYTSTPDGHFILDRHPRHPRVVVASPCSGHGFKFAPVIGEALADLASAGATGLPVGFLGLGRFAG
jgi:sarcosine oxidase